MLEVKNLICGYDTREVIKGISFSLEKGLFLGIIGPNGAGKTTLFRSLSRIIRPWKGSVELKGRDIFNFNIRDFAREAAVLSSDLFIPFAFSVQEFICLGRFPYLNRLEGIRHKDMEAVEHAMELTDTLYLRDRMINEISQGERQRVFLAQALAQEPQLLLLDEPTSHLDITHQVQMLNLLKKLNREQGLTVMMILHDLNLASEYCDNLMLINDGRIYKMGAPREVLTYETIEAVYKTVVIVKNNPISGKPYVFIISQDAR